MTLAHSVYGCVFVCVYVHMLCKFVLILKYSTALTQFFNWISMVRNWQFIFCCKHAKVEKAWSAFVHNPLTYNRKPRVGSEELWGSSSSSYVIMAFKPQPLTSAFDICTVPILQFYFSYIQCYIFPFYSTSGDFSLLPLHLVMNFKVF